MNGTTTDAIVDRTRHYVRRNFLYMQPGARVDPDEPLLQNGVVDSMGVVELVTFIQDEFEIVVEDDEITESNFGTLNSIARYVASKVR